MRYLGCLKNLSCLLSNLTEKYDNQAKLKLYLNDIDIYFYIDDDGKSENFQKQSVEMRRSLISTSKFRPKHRIREIKK